VRCRDGEVAAVRIMSRESTGDLEIVHLIEPFEIAKDFTKLALIRLLVDWWQNEELVV
jgi:hypothetical protein